ncbi:TetR family transcriptional regulator [Pseudomonas coronafaciens pv. oryzae]|nr:TetR family transcriptional regulator [Pseudomonas coronafaciens pv. oryzae]RMT10421.1 TetR family transcriptional regulator [Pseudomonas coronafaciens pv. oryzae]
MLKKWLFDAWALLMSQPELLIGISARRTCLAQRVASWGGLQDGKYSGLSCYKEKCREYVNTFNATTKISPHRNASRHPSSDSRAIGQQGAKTFRTVPGGWSPDDQSLFHDRCKLPGPLMTVNINAIFSSCRTARQRGKYMKVTKAQAQANRAHIVETASVQFRERGFDGVGIADLMAAAGFTHGGFYKHFGSKSDLMAESAACSIQQTVEKSKDIEPAQFIDYYLSRNHRDNPGTGCTMAALGGDAARQSDEVKATFAKGIESILAAMQPSDERTDGDTLQQARAQTIDMFAHAIGALLLSRSCPDDSPLADEILEVCRAKMLAQVTPAQAG